MLIAVSAVAAMPLGKVELLLWQRWIIAAASIAVPPLGKVGSSIPSEVMLPEVGCWARRGVAPPLEVASTGSPLEVD